MILIYMLNFKIWYQKINRNNYEENLERVEEITKLLENNPEVKDELEENLLNKYEAVKTLVNEYDAESNKTFVLVVSVILVVIFSILVIWIFMKEDE